MKREAWLKSQFFQTLKMMQPRYYVLHHSTRAAPDYSISGDGRTTFWEFKHATPDFESPGDQELMCMRLALASFCRYVIWKEPGPRTLIVRPHYVHDRSLVADARCDGFNHSWLVEEIVKVHRRTH